MSGIEHHSAGKERRRSAERLVSGTEKNNLKRRRRELIRQIATQEQLLKDAEMAARHGRSLKPESQQTATPTAMDIATSGQEGELEGNSLAAAVTSEATQGIATVGDPSVSLSDGCTVKSEADLKGQLNEELSKENITWIPGLPFPAEYYVRVTRRRASGSSVSPIVKSKATLLASCLQGNCGDSGVSVSSPHKESFASTLASSAAIKSGNTSPLPIAQANLSFGPHSPLGMRACKGKPSEKSTSLPAISPKSTTEMVHCSSSQKLHTRRDSLPKELLSLLANVSPTDPLPGTRRRRQVIPKASPKKMVESFLPDHSVRQFFPSPELLSDACDLNAQIDFALPDDDGFGQLKLLRLSRAQLSAGSEAGPNLTSSQRSCSSATSSASTETESVLGNENRSAVDSTDQRSKHRKTVWRRKAARGQTVEEKSGQSMAEALSGECIQSSGEQRSQQPHESKHDASEVRSWSDVAQNIGKSFTGTSHMCEKDSPEQTLNNYEQFPSNLSVCEGPASSEDISVFGGDQSGEQLPMDETEIFNPPSCEDIADGRCYLEMPESATNWLGKQPCNGQTCTFDAASLIEQCSLVHSTGDGEACRVQSLAFGLCSAAAGSRHPVLAVVTPQELILWQAVPQTIGRRWSNWEVLHQWQIDPGDKFLQVQVVVSHDNTVIAVTGGQFNESAVRIFSTSDNNGHRSFSLVSDDPLYCWPDVELRHFHSIWVAPSGKCKEKEQLVAVSAVTDSALDEVVIVKWIVNYAHREVCSITSLPTPCNLPTVTSFHSVYGDDDLLVATSTSLILVWDLSKNVLLREISLACCTPSGIPQTIYAAVKESCLFLTIALTGSRKMSAIAAVLAVDLQNGKATCIHDCQLDSTEDSDKSVVRVMCASSCGLLMAAALEDTTLLLWNLQKDKPCAQRACNGCPSSLAFHEAEPLLGTAFSSDCGRVKIFSIT